MKMNEFTFTLSLQIQAFKAEQIIKSIFIIL